MPEGAIEVLSEEQLNTLREQLGLKAGTSVMLNTFAILDGAAIPDLLETLDRHQPRVICLFRGELPADLAETAPYLVQLERGSPFTEWVLQEGWGRNWGVFALSGADLRGMRRHFRMFLKIHDPENRPLYFRFYDPRVLRNFLPTCDAAQTREMFGPVVNYLVEGPDADKVLRFWPGPKATQVEALVLETGRIVPAE